MRPDRDGPEGPDDAYDLAAYEDHFDEDDPVEIESIDDLIEDPEAADLRHVIPLERCV